MNLFGRYNGTCNHRSADLKTCVVFASTASSIFVLNLYLLVPKSIQKLSRSDSRQVKWRTFSVLVTIAFIVSIYPFIFCDDNEDYGVGENNKEQVKSLGVLLGFSGWTWRQMFLPVVHAMVLYFGPIVTSALKRLTLFLYKKRRRHSGATATATPLKSNSFLQKIVSPIKWVKIRDLLIAPLAEEVIFRSCIVTPFLHSDAFKNGRISIAVISWCTPLFFGIAHLHHALRRLKEESNKIKIVLLTSAFQLLYTTIFGAYASFCFVRTGSLPGVFVLHSFCNFMGLPSIDFFFLDPQIIKELRFFKGLGSVAYVLGIVFFWRGFNSSVWLYESIS